MMSRFYRADSHVGFPAARVLAVLAIIVVSASAANAQTTLTWDANGTTAGQTDGAGAWLGANQWWSGSTNADWTSSDSAVFGVGGAGGAVSLSGPTAVGSLTFNYFTGTYTLGTAAQEITLNSGITKNAGAGIVTFSALSPIKLGAAPTFTNNSATNLVIGALNLNGNALTFSGTGVITFEGNAGNVMSGAGGIIKNGTGTLILDAGAPNPAHTFTGGITVNGGVVFFQTATNVSGRGNVTLNNGYLEGRFSSSPSFSGGLGTGATAIQILGGTSGFSGQGGTTSTFTIGTALSVLKWGATGENGATGFFNPTVLVATGSTNTNAKGSLNNAIDLNGTTRTITSLHTTGDGATSTGFTISGAISNTFGTAGLTKTGPGALILGAANTYNGATSIQGGSLILSAAAATINSTTSLALSGGGTLRLVNTAQVNRFADGAAITVSSGGGIDYINTSGANVYTETVGAATVSGGQFNVNLATAQASTGSQTLTLGGLSQSGTGSVTFSALTTGPQATGNKNMIVVTGAGTTTAGEIIGPWATTGTTAALQTDYAVYNAAFVTAASIGASAETAWSTDYTTTTGTLNNTLVNAAGSAFNGRLTATRNINSVRANSATNAIASGDFTNDTFTVTGSTFANGDVITLGGTAPAGLNTGQPYYVVGASGDTFSVAATSGGTKIDLTGLGTSNITAGITLSSGNNLGTFGILNAQGSGLAIGGSGTGVVTLPTTSAGSLYVTPGNGAVISIGAPIADKTGALTLVKGGSSVLRLYSANTYTGDTIINAGTLQIGVNSLTTGANLGSGSYAGNIFIGAGATLDFQTNSNQTLSGVISGDGNLLKRYIGTLTLSGNNTYTGKTTLGAITNAGDPTLVVSSFNSVSAPVASSSLGRPTTVANGTIEMGSNNSSPNPTLRYNGTGETTDRVINFVFNSGASRTLDASGASGLLKFTSAFTFNGTATGAIVLQGTGAGELERGLPFAFTNFTKSGTGTWTLGGAVGNTGITTVSASGGTLALQKTSSLLGGANTNWTAAKIIVNTGGTLALNVGGSGEFNNTDITTILTNLGGAINNNGLRAGSNIGFNTTNASGGTFTIANNIANSTGTGSGAIGLTKLGTGTLVLTGVNTYSGGTVIRAGTLAADTTGPNTATGTAAVTVNSGTLRGIGNIAGAITLNGGTIAPGDDTGSGVLSTTSMLVASPLSGSMSFNVSGGLVNSSQLFINAAGNLNLGSSLTLSVTPFTGATDPDHFTLIGTLSGTTVNGSFSNFTEGATVFTNSGTGTAYLINYGTFSGEPGNVVLSAAPVPEPVAVGLVIVAGLGVLLRRRR